jgi:hypothetical protein
MGLTDADSTFPESAAEKDGTVEAADEKEVRESV